MIIENKDVVQLTDDRAPGFSPWCLTGGNVEWGQINNLKNSENLKFLLGMGLKSIGVRRCFTTKNGMGSERVVDNSLLDDTYDLSGGIVAHRNLQESANAVWLEPGDAFMELTTNQMLIGAFGGDYVLAGRYSSWMASRIVDAFDDKGVPPCDIQVVTFFTPPNGGNSRFITFENECFAKGVGSFKQCCNIPQNGKFPHAKHRNPDRCSPHSLGIIARL